MLVLLLHSQVVLVGLLYVPTLRCLVKATFWDIVEVSLKSSIEPWISDRLVLPGRGMVETAATRLHYANTPILHVGIVCRESPIGFRAHIQSQNPDKTSHINLLDHNFDHNSYMCVYT